ncbi:MAG: oligosaccharide flippase family protein [Lachnospiraceae bacterium]|nr:oligosaccharide flippase family protein [Lachnospiraceae bacterium]
MEKDIGKKAFKSGVWYTACNFLVKSIGFISTPIFTRLLTQHEFGLYNNYLSWMSLFTVFITINFEASLISAKHDFEKDFSKYVFSLVALTGLIGSVWMVIFNGLHAFITVYTNVDQMCLNSMVLYIVFSAIINIYQAKERYEYEYKKTVTVSLIISIVSTLLSVLLVLCMNDKLYGRVLGNVIPNVLLGVICLYLLREEINCNYIKYWKYALKVCLPYIPHVLAGSVLGSIDRIMIQKYWGSTSTALYSLAYNCGLMVSILALSINNAFSPWLSDKLNSNEFEEIRRVSKVYVSIFMYCAIGIMLISPEVLYILGGENYIESKYVISPVAMGCVCQLIYTLYVNVEQVKKKTIGMAGATVIAAVVNYVLNYLFIPSIGYLAAAYTTLIGYFCLLLVHMLIVKKIKFGHLYDNIFMFGVLIIGCIAMIFITLSYSYNLYRYIAIVIYIVVTLLLLHRYKTTIKQYIKKRR